MISELLNTSPEINGLNPVQEIILIAKILLMEKYLHQFQSVVSKMLTWQLMQQENHLMRIGAFQRFFECFPQSSDPVGNASTVQFE